MNNIGTLCCLLLAVCGASTLECPKYKKVVNLETGKSVQITSPGYPSLFGPNTKCAVVINGKPGSKFRMECPEFNIPGGSKTCIYGYLEVYEQKSRSFAKVCGDKPGLTVAPETGSPQGFQLDLTLNSLWGKGKFACTIYSVQASSKPQVIQPDKDFKCRCGKKNSKNRIVGGLISEVHEYPWQAAIFSRRGSRPFCGGSIITDKHIMTAAHCTIDRTYGEIEIGLGEHDVFSDSDNSIRVATSRILNHPDYNTKTTDYDYAIITLAESQRFSKAVQPICLPKDQTYAYTGDTCTISGWGTTSENGQTSTLLKEALVKVISNEQCKKIYGRSRITDRMLCALGVRGVDSCQGDSGGPLSCPQGDNFELAGVVSFGSGCARPGIPGVYGRITTVQRWIQRNINGGKTCPRK